MSQRNSEYERKEKDFYPTPAWCTEALIPFLPRRPRYIWEPACGDGAMHDVLSLHAKCRGTDIATGVDFLNSGAFDDAPTIDAIITNPPYNLATEFIEYALHLMQKNRGMVAMLLRTDFDHAKTRRHLFGDCPAFAKKVVLTKRIVWFAGPDGKPKASPSFNHCWLIWDWKHKGPPTLEYHYADAKIKTPELELT